MRSRRRTLRRGSSAIAACCFGLALTAPASAAPPAAPPKAKKGARVPAATAAGKPKTQSTSLADAGAPAGDAGAADAAHASLQAVGGNVYGTCIEHVPSGKARPKLEEKLPARGLSGHVATLEVIVHHGKGETVLPDGFHFGLSRDDARALERAGFALPDPDGGAGPSLKVVTHGDRATTTVRIPFVALPPKPGRQTLTLPPVPIAIARASGDVITLCTKPHTIVIDDPTANTPHAKPRANPKPRRQRELWETAERVTWVALIALVVGALVAWLIGKWLKREKPVPPPPPPRPPWEVALEELFDIRHAGLIKDQRLREHFERVSYAVRKYLGNRYGFDGLESTTHEILLMLAKVVPPVPIQPEIQTFLRQADLVKFAKLTPSEEECEHLLQDGEQIVKTTIPPPYAPGGPGPGAPPGSPPAQGAPGAPPEQTAPPSSPAPPEQAAPPSPWAPPEQAAPPSTPAPPSDASGAPSPGPDDGSREPPKEGGG